MVREIRREMRGVQVGRYQVLEWLSYPRISGATTFFPGVLGSLKTNQIMCQHTHKGRGTVNSHFAKFAFAFSLVAEMTSLRFGMPVTTVCERVLA